MACGIELDVANHEMPFSSTESSLCFHSNTAQQSLSELGSITEHLRADQTALLMNWGIPKEEFEYIL